MSLTWLGNGVLDIMAISLKGLSAQQLTKLSKKASALAKDLLAKVPSYSLALEHGVSDDSYNTTANGFITSYRGVAIIELADGSKWKAVGHPSTGDAYYADDGYIEFIPLEDNKDE